MIKRLGYSALFIVVVCLVARGAQSSLTHMPALQGFIKADLTATPIPLNPHTPGQTSLGEVTYMGGLVLKSSSPFLGGLSALRFLDDGRALFVSDRGMWVGLRLIEDEERLTSAEDLSLAPLLDQAAKSLSFDDRDSESVELFQNKVFVSFERNHRIWWYKMPTEGTLPRGPGHATREGWSAWMESMPTNGGVEAYARKDNAQVAISEERLHANGGHDARLLRTCAGCAPIGFGLVREGIYKPTDAFWFVDHAGQKDFLFVLYRAFSPFTGVRAKLKLYHPQSIHKGSLIDGETLLTLSSPISVDNMEGLAVVERAGRIFFYLVSDDNFSSLQRTLLMKFEWRQAALSNQSDVHARAKTRG